jgi:hypothetical protein
MNCFSIIFVCFILFTYVPYVELCLLWPSDCLLGPLINMNLIKLLLLLVVVVVVELVALVVVVVDQLIDNLSERVHFLWIPSILQKSPPRTHQGKRKFFHKLGILNTENSPKLRVRPRSPKVSKMYGQN